MASKSRLNTRRDPCLKIIKQAIQSKYKWKIKPTMVMNRDTFIQLPVSAHLITHPGANQKIDISYILDDPNHQAAKQTSYYKLVLANETENQDSSGSQRLVKFALPINKQKAPKGDDLKPAENRVLSRLQSAFLSSSETPQDKVFISELRFFFASFIFQTLLPFNLFRHGRPIVEFLSVSSNQTCPSKNILIPSTCQANKSVRKRDSQALIMACAMKKLKQGWQSGHAWV